MRWLTVGLIAHVAATCISQTVLALQIRHHLGPESLFHAGDLGPSYVVVAIMAVLAYHLARPWRWGYVVVLILVFVAAWLVRPGVATVGDLSALFIGLCCYPIVMRRPHSPWNPATLWTREGHAPQ